MDDLISRWAAIDVLTDTNLKRNIDSVCDGDVNRTRRAAQRVIAQLPAVDAVPVEWLRDEAELLTRSEDGFNKYVGEALIIAVRYWNTKKEASQCHA